MNLNTGKITPRQYQWDAYTATGEHIRASTEPAFVEASVGAGKTIMIAMVCKRAQDVGMSALVLARQGELVEQNAEELWKLGVKNSIYSASLNKKSTTYPIICGTEGTVARALDTELKEYAPDFLLIDECHMVDWEDAMEDEPSTQYGQIIKAMYQRNPRLRIIGYTGSPYRGVEPILGQFWKKRLIQLDTNWLIERNFLVPTVFGYGHDDVQYDLKEFKPTGQDGTADLTAQQMREMEAKILKEHTTTQRIMLEVQELAKDRNGVLITCAGKKHCEEAASMLPEGSYGIVTDSTPKRERADILRNAKEGRLKYVLQIGCLTTGVNIPRWDTVVILRSIGSLTLLVQLIGRGLRLPTDDFKKDDCLILDYSGTMHEMGELYHNPILEQAEIQRSRGTGELIQCPKCYTENSKYARRCVGASTTSSDGRCEWFWQSKECPSCGCENDTTARDCRNCGEQLRDPNEKLTGKHYTDDDYVKVNKMHMTMTKNQQDVVVSYDLEDGERATEFFYPFSQNPQAKNAWRNRFVFKHAMDKSKALKMRSVTEIIKMKAIFNAPLYITHRRNDKGKSIIHRKKFRSGRVEES